MAFLFNIPQAVRIDSTGAPYPGAKANFYLTGTTTRTDSYTDNALVTPHANPVVADAAGQFAAIYLDPAITYRCIITDTDDVQIDDVDPVSSPIPASAIAVTDSGGHFAGTEVETILTDLGANYGKKSAANTWSADQTLSGAALKCADNVVERPELKDYSLTQTTITSSSNAITADCSTGNSFYHLLTENTTFTLSNPSPTGKVCSIMIRIKQDGAGGAYTVTWPGTVVWAGGSAPTITTSNDAIDVITLFTDDAGTTWYGNYAQAYA